MRGIRLSLFALSLLGCAACSQPGATDRTMILALEGEPSTLTAHLSSDLPAIMVASNLFNGLVGYDYDFEPTPDLAERWDVSDDGLRYTFHLSQAARWHDGEPVTAEDVEFTFNDVLAEHHPRAARWWSNVESARATDRHTFVVTLKSPFAPFLTVIGNGLGSGTLILPKHVYDGTDPRTNPANQAPVGSGPFVFSSWTAGSHIELVRNEAYFKPGLPRLDRLVFQIVPDAATRLLAFERGEIDFIHAYIVPYEAVERLSGDDRFRVLETGLEGAATNENLLFNHRHPALGDLRVRRAIAHAIDREAIVEKALFGLGEVAHSHINSSLVWAHAAGLDPYEGRDVERARALLRDAAVAGSSLRLRLTHDAGKEAERRAAAIVQDNLRDIGMEVVLEPLDRPTYIDRTFRQWDFDLALQNFVTGPDPALSVTSRYHSKQVRRAPFVNAMGYENETVDALMEADIVELDREERAEIWRRLQQILMEELPVLPLFEYPVLNLVSSRFDRVVTHPNGYLQSREEARLRP